MTLPRPFGRLRWPSGLSSRLLLLTAAFVVVADLFILAPALSSFEERWLLDRIRRAEIAAGAVDVAPDNFVPDRLADRLLTSAGVTAVAIKEQGRRRLVLAAPQMEAAPDFTDLRRGRIVSWLVAPWKTLFGAPDRMIRAIASPCCRTAEFIEIVTPAEPLKRDLWSYLVRIFALSVLISVLAGALIYAALSAFIVRPMRRITASIEQFRADPEDPDAAPEHSGRRDEIGRVEEELATMQEEVRQALRSRARLAALGEAVAKINHDLRNMLTSAQLASERLADSGDPVVAQALPRLERALDRALGLTRDVLNYGKSEVETAPRVKKAALRAAVEAAGEDAGLSPTGVVLKADIGRSLSVEADPEQLHRILVNLMRNARQAVEATERVGGGVVSVSAERLEGALAIRVADNGGGIPEKVLDRLFQPFAGSGRAGGAGLGLAISRELAQAHGGEVRLLETGPEGSVFELLLPQRSVGKHSRSRQKSS
ncbi:MAG: HAMP domain-containing histidine kinase [Caulobacteraceae bacterium]|nr:HAMP domain-containing histidine kinase [Caulobacteraceae bacterium]